MVTVTFYKANHHLITFVLYIVSIQIVFDLCLNLGIIRSTKASRITKISRFSKITNNRSLACLSGAGEDIGGTYQCHKWDGYI